MFEIGLRVIGIIGPFLLFFGVIGARLAVSRGRWVYLGFFVGVLLGPLGLLLVMMRPKPPNHRHQDDRTPSNRFRKHRYS